MQRKRPGVPVTSSLPKDRGNFSEMTSWTERVLGRGLRPRYSDVSKKLPFPTDSGENKGGGRGSDGGGVLYNQPVPTS